MAICSLILLFVLGCGFMLTDPTPVVVTREVTRVVVVTATPTYTPLIVERVITVTVVMAATPTLATVVPEETFLATPTPTATEQTLAPTATEQVLHEETATPIPTPVSPTTVPSPDVQPSAVAGDLDDPVVRLAALSGVAKAIQSRGTHTLRLTMDLSVPIEATVRDREQVDERLTRLVRNELSDYDIQGNYIIDISVDDLVQQKWVIEAVGGIAGLGVEELAELRQSGDRVWEKPVGEEWSLRRLTPDEAPLPLGNSLVGIDAYSHALNLSDLIVDALRPLLLVGAGEQSMMEQVYGWTAVTADSSTESLLEMHREREIASSNNLKAIAASLANTGLSTFADPAAVTNGIQQITSAEKAWLIPDTRLVDHSQVDIKGTGTIDVVYLMQKRLLDATVTLRTDNSFEYLSSMTIVTAPDQ